MTNSVPGQEAALTALVLAEEQAAADYIALARCFRGWEAAALRRLARECQARGACLRGIRTLVSGEAPEIQLPARETGPVGIQLRKCYCRAMRTLVAYEARSRDAEYGPIFAKLAAQQQEHCRTLLELIGSTGG